jgi:hypothetical protein
MATPCRLCGHTSPHVPATLIIQPGTPGQHEVVAPVWCEECDDPCWRRCVCGHGGDDHFVYTLDGADRMRCRRCDPLSRPVAPPRLVLEADTYEAAMYYAADHDYEEAPDS